MHVQFISATVHATTAIERQSSLREGSPEVAGAEGVAAVLAHVATLVGDLRRFAPEHLPAAHPLRRTEPAGELAS